MRFRGVVTAVFAITLVQACDSDADLPLETFAPQFTFEDDSTCAARGDIAPAAFTLLQSGCAAADDGFDDDTVTFQYETRPAVGSAWDSIESYFLLTYEFRVADADSFGIRRVDVEAFDASVFGDTSLRVTPDPFTVRLLKDLTGAGFINYVVGCKESTSEQQVDLCLQAASTDWHYETAFCIDNREDNTFVDAVDLCIPLLQGLPLPDQLNQLPTAAFFSSTPAYNSLTECHDVSFNAAPSSDPESGSLSYSWTFESPDPGESINPAQTATVAREFCAEGVYTVRLKVQDGAGGIDVETKFVPVEAPPPPEPFTVEINGAEFAPENQDCIYYRVVSGGVSPYTYEWRRSRVLGVVSTDISYLAYTGTSSFTLTLDAWDSDGGHATDTLAVTVTGGFGFCPSV